MAYSIPTIEPASATAGDTWKWTIADLSEFTISDGWALTYSFRYLSGGLEGEMLLNLTSSQITAGSGVHSVVVPAATTARLRPGTWQWTAYATLGAERYVVGTGKLVIYPDLATQTPTETDDEISLRNLNVAIHELEEHNAPSYSVNGRSVTKQDLPSLYLQRNNIEWRLWRASNPGRQFVPVGIRFVDS